MIRGLNVHALVAEMHRGRRQRGYGRLGLDQAACIVAPTIAGPRARSPVRAYASDVCRVGFTGPMADPPWRHSGRHLVRRRLLVWSWSRCDWLCHVGEKRHSVFGLAVTYATRRWEVAQPAQPGSHQHCFPLGSGVS